MGDRSESLVHFWRARLELFGPYWMAAAPTTNFGVLREHDEQLRPLAVRADKYFPEDPITCPKLLQLAEDLALLVFSRTSLYRVWREYGQGRMRGGRKEREALRSVWNLPKGVMT
jgi:hypothetical protein